MANISENATFSFASGQFGGTAQGFSNEVAGQLRATFDHWDSHVMSGHSWELGILTFWSGTSHIDHTPWLFETAPVDNRDDAEDDTITESGNVISAAESLRKMGEPGEPTSA